MPVSDSLIEYSFLERFPLCQVLRILPNAQLPLQTVKIPWQYYLGIMNANLVPPSDADLRKLDIFFSDDFAVVLGRNEFVHDILP